MNASINNRKDMEPISTKIIALVAAPVVAIMAWIGKRIHTRLDNHDKQIRDLQISEAVQESRFKEIDKKLDKILDKLDHG